MQLHILNSSASLNRCLSSISDTDSIILIEDAVVLSTSIMQKVSASIAVYALNDDLARRGINPSDNIKALSYSEFVDLCVTHTKCLSW